MNFRKYSQVRPHPMVCMLCRPVRLHAFSPSGRHALPTHRFSYPAGVRLSPPLAAATAHLCAALAAAAIVLASSSGCSSSHHRAASTQTFDGAAFPAGLRAPKLALTNQDGRRVSLDDHGGRVRVLAFISAADQTGVLVAQQIRGALDELGRRAGGVQVLLVSAETISPRTRGANTPTPTSGKPFLHETSLAGRAQYLTGSPEQLSVAWKAYGLPPARTGVRAYLASTPVILVDSHGFERVGFPVEQLTPEGLAHDIGALLGS
jgi:protein SCO1/2